MSFFTLEELQSELLRSGFTLSDEQVRAVYDFSLLLYQENEVQNLTRIVGVQDFVQGHFLDAWFLYDSKLLKGKVFDLGSGGGIPGLLLACLFRSCWPRGFDLVLNDAEIRKAEFLDRSVAALGLQERVKVAHGRVENVLTQVKPDMVIARAVGKVDLILKWIDTCSTWNTLYLLKGPGWEKEWNDAKYDKKVRKLTLAHKYDYSRFGLTRFLVELQRNNVK